MNRSKFFAVLAFLFALTAPLVVTTVEAQSSTFGDGTAIFFDDEGRNDGVRIEIAGVAAPPQGKEYVAWLVTDNGEGFLNLGSLSVEGGTVTHIFGSESEGYDGVNLIQRFSGWAITIEDQGRGANLPQPSNRGVVYDSIPAEAIGEIRKQDVAAHQTVSQVALALDCAERAKAATSVEDAKSNIQCAINILEGVSGDNYDESVDSGGDGVGILNHITNLQSASESLGDVSVERPDLADASASSTRSSANVDTWTNQLHEQALRVQDLSDLDKIRIFIGPGGNSVISLLQAAANGYDSDGDGTLNENDPAETGAIYAARSTQLAATLRTTAGELPIVATPTPIPTPTPAATATPTATPTPTPIPQPAGPGLPGVGGLTPSGSALAMALAAALAIAIGGLTALRANRARIERED